MTESLFDIRQYLLDNLVKSQAVGTPNGYIDSNSLDLTKLEFVGYDFEYGDINKQMDDPLYVDIISETNNTSSPQVVELQRDYATTATLSWSVTKGLKHVAKVSIRVGAPKQIINISAEYSIEISSSETTTKTDSATQTWKVRTPINIQPHTKVLTNVIVDKANYTAPFRFNGELKGTISFIAMAQPEGSDPNIGIECEGPLTDFLQGMPEVPELSIKNGKLTFSGGGIFRGVAGLDINIKSDEYPTKILRLRSQ